MSNNQFNGFRLASRLISLILVSYLAIANPEVKLPTSSGKNSSDLLLSGDISLQARDSRYIQAITQSSRPREQLALKFAEKPQVKPILASRVITRSQATSQTAVVTTVSTPINASPYDDLFNKYSGMFGVDERKLKIIAKCESHYNPGVQSKNGLYGGMYQYSASTWSATRAAMGADPNPELRFDAEQSIMTSAWKIAHGGIGAWPVCGKK